MSEAIKSKSLIFMWFVISTVVVISNAYETYDETDQLAEESVGGNEDEGQEETTTTANISYSLEKAIVENDDRVWNVSSVEDESNDPLQKILPKVKFNCKGKSEGYYADRAFCEVFHYCKTNGFRFTFMCPTDSYYNIKLMACEYNSSVSSCKDKDKHHLNNENNTTEDTTTTSSVEEHIEVFESMATNIEKSNYVSTSSTTVSTTTVKADPYLTKWKTAYGLRVKVNESDTKSLQNSTNSINIPQNTKNITNNNKLKTNETKVLLPFRGFRRHNRTKSYVNKNNSNNNNNNSITTTTTTSTITQSSDLNLSQSLNSKEKQFKSLDNSSDSSVRISSNAWPVISSLRNQLIVNSSHPNNYRTKSRSRTTTTTPSVPSVLLSPTTTTVPPFQYFNPLNIFNSNQKFQTNLDLYSQSSHNKETNEDNSNRRPPVMTQNYFNTIFHTPDNKSIEIESKLQETQNNDNLKTTQTYETNSGFSQYLPQEVIGQDFVGQRFLNRVPVFESVFNNQPKNLRKMRNNRIKSSESVISSVRTKPSIPSMNELIERLREIEANQQLDSKVVTDYQSNDEINETDDKETEENKPMLSVPVLVPTGMSKNDLNRGLSASVLKPTTIPLTDSGHEIPAYVLQFEDTKRSHKTKRSRSRAKRQAFNWNNNYLGNPFLSNPYYLPMTSMSSPVYANYNNQFRDTLPLGAYHSRHHLNIGEKPGYRLHPSAQHHLPYYMPPKQPFMSNPNNPFGHNFNLNENIYDLSEFSDFYSNPLHKRPKALMARDEVPYRSVSLKRQAFKRPPLRDRIPDVKKDRNGTESDKTVKVFASDPVSTRPYSRPLPKRQFYSKNSNPFSDFSDGNIAETIKLFNSNEDQFQPFTPIDPDSQTVIRYNSPQSYSNDFIPILSNKQRPNALNGRSSRITSYSQSPVNAIESNNVNNNNFLEDFPPLPKFGDPEYRLPFVDIPDPTLRNSGFKPKYNENYNNYNKESVDQKHVNYTSRSDNSSRHSTPYMPEDANTNESDRNPNHNYDNVDNEKVQTTRTQEFNKFGSNFNRELNWDNIVGQYNKPNISFTKSASNLSKDKKMDENEPKDKEHWNNVPYVSYGTRLSGNANQKLENPQISVKSSVRAVSSLEAQPSNQIIISKKSGTSLHSSEPVVDDNRDPNMNELYNQRASNRLMLFNYYSHFNPTKPKYSTTTTVNPLDPKYPSTSHWSIRGWNGQYYPSSPKTTTTTTTELPKTTKIDNRLEYLDLTTELPSVTTTVLPEPPYKKIFYSTIGAPVHTNTYSKPNSNSKRTQSDISNYLNSFTSTTKSI